MSRTCAAGRPDLYKVPRAASFIIPAVYRSAPVRQRHSFVTMYLRTNSPTPGRPIDREAIKASGFKNAGILVADLDDPRLSWVDREELKRIGTKLYGPKAS